MRRKHVVDVLIAGFIIFFCRYPAMGTEWDVQSDLLRLSMEVPSPVAFPGVDGIVWLSSYNYSLRSDGGMGRKHRYLAMLTDDGENAPLPMFFERPSVPGASLEVTEASWYDPSSGEKNGSLDVRLYEDGEMGWAKISIPHDALGCVIAIETNIVNPKKYFLDDLLVLAGERPLWEQSVEVEIPQDMTLYWQGTGVRNPERVTGPGVERIVWIIRNQPVWRNSGMFDEYPPTLLFSLRKGLSSYLRELRGLENSFVAPPVPAGIYSVRGGSLQKIGDGIASYMRDRVTAREGLSIVRGNNMEPGEPDRQWTPLEGTFTAGKWLESMGYGVKIFWSQRVPVNRDGPDTMGIWREPVLVVSKSGIDDVYFTAGQTVDFGKVPPYLYGAQIYRFDGGDVQRLTLPRGSASDHTLSQQWRLSLDENGVALGSLDITVTGGWTSVLSGGDSSLPEDVARNITSAISFGVLGISMEPESVQTLGNGYRLRFGVRAPIGIVSGGNILMKIPGGIPASLSAIAGGGEAFSFNFPFVFEQNVVISTPSGYRSFALPGKTQHGDSKAMVDESIVYRDRRDQIEASSKWIVRTAVVDKSLAGRIMEQLAIVRRWTDTTIPLRK